MIMGWAIVIGLIVVAVIFIGITIGGRIKIYNHLVTRRNKVKNSWAHVEAQLQRRFDLVPSLVESVRGVAAHERQIFEDLNTVLNRYLNAHTNQEKLAMDAELSTRLQAVYAMVEGYPQLKTNQNFLQLQEALTEIEEDISYARQFYNDAVTIYNNARQKFPNNMIAAKYGFEEEELFEAVRGAETAPKIFFNTKTVCPVCGATSDGSSPMCKYCGTSMS